MKTVHHNGTGLLDSREQTSEYARTAKRLWDQTARPGPAPDPAPRTPHPSVRVSRWGRRQLHGRRGQSTRHCWSGAGPGRTTELKPKCPRAVAVLMDQPSRTGTTAVPGRSQRARVCHFRRHLAQFPRRSHRPHGLWGCPGPASPSPASLRSLQRGSALAPAPETTPGGAQHRLSVQEQTRGPPVGPPSHGRPRPRRPRCHAAPETCALTVLKPGSSSLGLGKQFPTDSRNKRFV